MMGFVSSLQKYRPTMGYFSMSLAAATIIIALLNQTFWRKTITYLEGDFFCYGGVGIGRYRHVYSDLHAIFLSPAVQASAGPVFHFGQFIGLVHGSVRHIDQH